LHDNKGLCGLNTHVMCACELPIVFTSLRKSVCVCDKAEMFCLLVILQYINYSV